MKTYAKKLEPILDIQGEFDVRDVKDKLPDDHSHQTWLFMLHEYNAIKSCGKEWINNNNSHIWVWNEEARKFLKEYAAQMNTLPCGCRSHIPAAIGPNTEIAECNHCGTKHTKETFREAL